MGTGGTRGAPASPCCLLGAGCGTLLALMSPTASLCVTHCQLHHPLLAPSPAADQGSHLSPCRHGRYKARFSFSYSKRSHVGIDCKPVPTQAKSQSWDGEKAPSTARLPGTATIKTSTSGVQAAGFRAVREGQED